MGSKKVWFITGAGRGMGADFTKAALAAPKKHGVKLGGDRGARLSRATRKLAGRHKPRVPEITRPIYLLFSATWSEMASSRGAASRGHSTTGASPLLAAERSGQQTQVARVAARLTV